MALDFFAGCLGGCAGVLVGHPLDTVKVRLQTQDVSRIVYRGTYHCISTIIEKESARGLFKGMSSPMAGLAAVNAVVFGTYGNLQRAQSNPNSLMSHALAGSAAGSVQSLITSPMELAKTRMQLQGQILEKSATPHWARPKMLYKNPLDCLKKVAKAEGIRGFYKGFWCTILRDAPGFAVYFAGFEYLTQKIASRNNQVSNLAVLLAGGVAGVVSWIVIYPFDVLKSRIQADGMEGIKKYNGIWDCIVKSYQKEGLNGFSRGLNSTLLRAFPTNAATFSVFTWVFVFCESRKQKISLDVVRNDSLMEKKLQRIACCMEPCT